MATAAISATWSATSHSTSRRAPAALEVPVTRASCPSAQSAQYAACHSSQATTATLTAHRGSVATREAATATPAEPVAPSSRLVKVNAVGRPRIRCASTHTRAATG